MALGVKAAGAWGWQPHHLHVPNVMKYGSLNLLEPCGPHRACYGTALHLHVSSDFVPIIWRNNSIYVTFYSVWVTVWYAGWNESVEFHSTLHIRQSSAQNNKYQVSRRYSYFSWWWAHSRPKHVEKRNKHTKKNCAPSWLYLQDPLTG